MDKEVKSVIRYYKILDFKFATDYFIKKSFIIYGVLYFIRFLINPNDIRRYLFSYAFLMILPVFLGLIASTITKIYEITNKHILGASKQIKISSVDEIVELLRADKKIHFEVMKKLVGRESLVSAEKTRYDGIRRFHYVIWYMQAELENDEFRRRHTTEKEIEQYIEKQTKIKEELLFVFDDDEEVQDMILEQYNRIRTKTLVWPKVISKE